MLTALLVLEMAVILLVILSKLISKMELSPHPVPLASVSAMGLTNLLRSIFPAVSSMQLVQAAQVSATSNGIMTPLLKSISPAVRSQPTAEPIMHIIMGIWARPVSAPDTGAMQARLISISPVVILPLLVEKALQPLVAEYVMNLVMLLMSRSKLTAPTVL